MTDLLHLLTAELAPASLDEVIDELRRAGVWGVTVTEVLGFGVGGARVERYRGATRAIDHRPWLRVEVVVETFDAERLAELVAVSAAGGGHVRLSPVDGIRRIRTGERGVDAL